MSIPSSISDKFQYSSDRSRLWDEAFSLLDERATLTQQKESLTNLDDIANIDTRIAGIDSRLEQIARDLDVPTNNLWKEWRERGNASSSGRSYLNPEEDKLLRQLRQGMQAAKEFLGKLNYLQRKGRDEEYAKVLDDFLGTTKDDLQEDPGKQLDTAISAMQFGAGIVGLGQGHDQELSDEDWEKLYSEHEEFFSDFLYNVTLLEDKTGLGHHLTPQAVIEQLFKEKKIDKQTYDILMAFTVDPTNYKHGNDTFLPGGSKVTHPKYNKAVDELLNKYVEKNGPINKDQVKDIMEWFLDPVKMEAEAKKLGVSNDSIKNMKNWHAGFKQSIIDAKIISDAAGGTLKPDEIKKLAQFMGAGDNPVFDNADDKKKYDQLKKYVLDNKNIKNVYDKILESKSNPTKWAKITKSATDFSDTLLKNAKYIVGFIVFVGIVGNVSDAYAGYTGNGHNPEIDGFLGAFDNLFFEEVFGSVVEGSVKGIAGEVFKNAQVELSLRRRGFRHGVDITSPDGSTNYRSTITDRIKNGHDDDLPSNKPVTPPSTGRWDDWFWGFLN